MNDLEKARIRKIIRRTHKEHETELFVEAAGMFGRHLGMAERAGLPRKQAIEAAQEHFRMLSTALLRFVEMAPELVAQADLKPKGDK